MHGARPLQAFILVGRCSYIIAVMVLKQLYENPEEVSGILSLAGIWFPPNRVDAEH